MAALSQSREIHKFVVHWSSHIFTKTAVSRKMSSQASPQPGLPSYTESTHDVDKIWDPTILVLGGLSIHAESVHTPALYHISRAVAVITGSTKQVEFERVELVVRDGTEEPVVKPRSRHIYNLKYVAQIPGGIGSPEAVGSPATYIQSVSRRTLGSIGIKRPTKHSRAKAKALPIDVSGKHSAYASLPSFIKNASPIFEMSEDKSKNEWTDKNGNAIAVEDWDDGQHKLIITASLPQSSVDAMVALWCCRIWQISAESAPVLDEGMERGKLSAV